MHGEWKDGDHATLVSSDVELHSVERGVIGTAVRSDCRVAVDTNYLLHDKDMVILLCDAMLVQYMLL